ncbi:MAG: universal stress protein [Gaiellales bacterium]|nr:MAG: universal stress protein [Gaiellales bacterium]
MYFFTDKGVYISSIESLPSNPQGGAVITRILVPTDGSERAEHAADFAIQLASDTGAELLFINVIDEVAPAFGYELEAGVSLDINEVTEQRRRYGEEAVAGLARKAEAAGAKAATSVIEGHPWQEILAEADRSGADHIVIGSHGRRALAAALLGNVAFNVIHGAKVPVTVIPWKE